MEFKGNLAGVMPRINILQMIYERLSGWIPRGIWRRPARKLKVCETLSLGNRGFLAVVRYQEQQFLVGGTNQSIAMLAQLTPASSPPERTLTESKSLD
jgi:flagellar biogenesis protein FliO